jgi:hypothetical protein
LILDKGDARSSYNGSMCHCYNFNLLWLTSLSVNGASSCFCKKTSDSKEYEMMVVDESKTRGLGLGFNAHHLSSRTWEKLKKVEIRWYQATEWIS